MSSHRQRVLWACAAFIFVVSFAVLAWGITRDGIAAPFVDPIAQTRTQDEAVHAAAAIAMARDGGWLTPKLMGRLLLFKPPLLIWLSAISIRILGLSLFSVRLPALLMGAAGVAGVFLWCVRGGGLAAGALGAGLLLFSPFWQIYSRVCLTDIPAAAFSILAMATAAGDAGFERRRTPLLFGTAVGASILAKSIAGVLPLLALGLYWLLLPRPERPPVRRLAAACGISAMFVIPWHLYQGLVHPRWFWADYVQVQLLGVGAHSQMNTLFARSPVFYLARFAQLDPVLGIWTLLGVAGALRGGKFRRQPAAMLALSAVTAAAAAMCLFQAKHLPYMVLLVPAACVVAVLCGPTVLRRPGVAAGILAALAGVKAIAAGQPWSLRPAAPPIEGARAMRQYWNLHRGVELIAAQPDDEFYSATLPLPRVRYCFLDPDGSVPRMVPYYARLGIILDARQFADLPGLLPGFARALRDWGLNSAEPVGTVIVLRTPEEIGRVIRSRPGADFYLPAEWVDLAGDATRTHEVVGYSASRVFLLCRECLQGRAADAPLPARW